jgi:hypothetical protein
MEERYSASRGYGTENPRVTYRKPGSGRDPARDEIWSNQKTACSTAIHSFQTSHQSGKARLERAANDAMDDALMLN